MAGSMRQLEERQLSADIILMQWSPKMDLLAIANSKGEVALHRLTWQRVWLLNCPKESDTITNLCWRPDGKLIAVTYKNIYHLYLVDIENKNVIYKTELYSNPVITCLHWLSLDETSHSKPNTVGTNSPTGDYLPPLPPLTRSFGQDPEIKEFLSPNPSILMIGQDKGDVSMYLYGMFHCGSIHVNNGSIIEIVGEAGKPLWVSSEDTGSIVINKLSCPLLESSDAFSKIAQIHGNIECLMDYMSRTLIAISEAWETILLELDEKLACYASSKPVGCASAEFLELLMIGVPSADLENFLLTDLTEKGLKKLSHSIEICYSNIQRLVLKHLHSVGMSLIYQLAEMRGMARLGGAYEDIGLAEESPITSAIHAAQAYLAKTCEIQQIIDHSMRDYKAFFRWLNVTILRLTDERVPPDMSRMSQQELTFIAEFLRSFDEIGSENGRKKVNLEKLGQYLRKEPLQTSLTTEGSEWAMMLSENECLKNHPLIIKQDLDFSLLQSHIKLVDSVNLVFSKCYTGLTNLFNVDSANVQSTPYTITSQIVTSNNDLLIAVMVNDSKLDVYKIEGTDLEQPVVCKWSSIKIDSKPGPPSIVKPTDNLVIVDHKFYSQKFLSLLLLSQQENLSYLIQMPINLTTIPNKDWEEEVNLNEIIGSVWPKAFQNFTAKKLAVSGARKVAAVLSSTNRKIRLLETEVEPEEEEEDEDNETGADNIMDVTMNASQ